MDTDDLKAALALSRRQLMQFAVVLGNRPEDHRLSLHPTRAGKALAKALREDTGLKLATWGVTEVDDARRDTLVLVLEDRLLTGLGKKLQAWLKLMSAPIRKVALKVDGQEVDDGESGAQESGDPSPSTPPHGFQAGNRCQRPGGRAGPADATVQAPGSSLERWDA